MPREHDALLRPEAPPGWLPPGRGKLLVLLVGICAVEGADVFLLGATFHALSRDLGVSPSDLGVLAMAQALMITVCGPAWAVMADRRVLSRQRILALGCLGWGCATIALGCVAQFHQMVMLRAVNGAFLGCLQPVCQGIVSDVTPAHQRGRVFGLLSSSLFVGMMGTSLFVTPISGMMLGGVMGWRIAYAVIGVLSVLLAAVVQACMDDTGQPKGPPKPVGGFLLAREAHKFTAYFRFRTFALLLVQGIFGAIPPQALTFLTMYFQLCGFTDVQAALVATMGVCGAAVGRAFGGLLGDMLALWWPGHGRPLTAQISVLLGAPLAFALVGYDSAPAPSSFRACASLSFALGLLATWALPALDRPVLAELVRAEQRVSIFGWRWMLEGASGAVLGAPLVGLLATKVWGYKLSANLHRALGPHQVEADVAQAVALGNAVCAVCVVPWFICFAVYCALHKTYGPDLKRVQEEEQFVEKAKRASAGAGAGAGV